MKKSGGRIAAFGLLAVILLAAVGAQFFSYWKSRVAVEPGAAEYVVSGKVDVNRADEAALAALPGIGQTMARRIVAWREAHGPFESVSQLIRVEGMGGSKLAALEGYICAEPPEGGPAAPGPTLNILTPPPSFRPTPEATSAPTSTPPAASAITPLPAAASAPLATMAPAPTPTTGPRTTTTPAATHAPTTIPTRAAIAPARENAAPTELPPVAATPASPRETAAPRPAPSAPIVAPEDEAAFFQFFNRAGRDDLEAALGDVMAARVIARRKYMGPYETVDQVLATEGMTEDLLRFACAWLQAQGADK